MAAERIVNITVNFLAPNLASFTTQLGNLNKEMAALRGETSKTRTQVSGLGKDAGKASDELNDYSKNANNAGKASDELNNSSKKARGGFANFGKQLVNTAAFLLRFAAVTAIFSGITFAIVGTAKAAAEFEAALKDLQAIANVTNDDLEKLSKNVLDVAGSTRFTATEIVGLQKSLARLGFETSQIIGATESIARFAEATGEASDMVAEFVGKQMKAFGLATIQVTEQVNAYTTSINNSALTLESLATSSQYVSSISSALGVTFKEQNALLATLADNGLTASRAGTGLRKIFLELGAEGGSLIPILNELGREGLQLSEAEELVGDRAAGALLALVNQRDAVRGLVTEQDNLTATLLASARQNSTFTGQVAAMSAAIDKLLIRLGDWVTKTEAVLEIIEFLGGGTTLRGFNVIDSLELSGAEMDMAIKNITSLEGGLDSLIQIVEVGFTRAGTPIIETQADLLSIMSTFGVTAERAAEIGEALEKSLSLDTENLDAGTKLFIEQNKQMQERKGILEDATAGTREYTARQKELSDAGKDSIGFEEKRNQLYEDATKKIKAIDDELGGYSEMTRSLTKDEERRVAVLEAAREQMVGVQRATINLKEGTEDLSGSNEVQLQSFESIRKKQDALAQAILNGDEAKRLALTADLEKQKSLLIELDLLDEYEDYLKRIEKLEKERAERALAERSRSRTGGQRVAQGQAIIRNLELSVAEGVKTPQQAAEEAFNYLEEVGKEFGFDSKYYKDLQSKVFNFADLITGGGKDGEISDEKKEFAIQQLGKFANEVNRAILDATQRRLEAEQAAVDARYSFEEDRLNSLLQAGIISQEQYERQRLRLEKERVAKTNEIERKRFNAEKANSLAQIAINTAIGISSAAGNVFKIAIISAAAAAQAAIVAAQKFTPTKFKKGGMIEGASHEQGGVPFTVAGRAGFEAEGGEFIVNKRATEAFLPMLERINSFGNSSIPVQRQAFANGGVVPQGGGRTDDLLEQLVSQSSQRTIAYISEEQLISRNNTRITNDIRKRL